MTPRVYIKTFGCQMNEHDSQRMLDLLVDSGYLPAASPEEATLIVLNTCSVRHNPENKVFSFLGTLRGIKQQRPETMVAVAGCVAQQEGRHILQREHLVDLVFGPDQMFHLPELLGRVRAGERVCATDWLPRDNA